MRKLFCLFITGLMASTVSGAGDPAAGEAKSETCKACHGPDGNSPSPAFPILAGQHADYMLLTLKEYKSGVRKNAIMGAQATALSEQDMKDLAAYYASQKGLESVEITEF